MASLTKPEVEQRIRDIFEENYELLRLEGGHALTADVKEHALLQVLYYYRKLADVAERVTDTEVKLTLPNQKTPNGRNYTIEGIVDIVKEGGETWMYDIKTHDPDYVKENRELYEAQLNVYSYIWQGLRGEQLDHTAVISTAFPEPLKHAIRGTDAKHIEMEMAKWEPLIEMPFDEKKVDDTIQEFGEVVDRIEENRFKPPALERLRAKYEGTNALFATRICRNCDARFSCSSYRDYALGTDKRSRSSFKKYFEDYGSDADQETWINANLNLDAIPPNNPPLKGED